MFNRRQTDDRSSIVRSALTAGIVALGVAIGIGRFAFTPLLPLMLRDGLLDAPAGAEWAAANYLGYLVGALIAGRMQRRLQQNLAVALLGIVISTALITGVHSSIAGVALRFVAGIFSAWVLVLASSLCLGTLERSGASHFGAWIFTGVGVGITVAGVLAWLGGAQPAQWLWLELGALAAIGTIHVLRTLRHMSDGPMAMDSGPTAPRRGHAGLVACYGSFGFGYIIPATFLPALAHAQIRNPYLFGLTWPIFGAAATLSVAIVARALSVVSRQRIWAVAQALMALGTALPVFTQRLGSLALSALLVGGTFMVATMAGLQLARELVPTHPTALIARMTAAFAVGQIAGPVLIGLYPASAATPWGGLTFASALAAALLAATAAWLWNYDSGTGVEQRTGHTAGHRPGPPVAPIRNREDAATLGSTDKKGCWVVMDTD